MRCRRGGRLKAGCRQDCLPHYLMSARPREGFGSCCEAGFYGVAFDVAANPFEFARLSNQVIVALVLSENTFSAKYLVGAMSSESFERSEPVRRIHAGCNQQMDVIWHDDERVQHISFKAPLSFLHGAHHDFGDVRSLKEMGSHCGSVKQPVHSYKRLTGGEPLGRKDAPGGQAAGEPKRHKHRLTSYVPVRQSPRVLSHNLLVRS